MIKSIQDLFSKTTTQTVEVKRDELIRLIDERNTLREQVARLKAQVEMLNGRVELAEAFTRKEIDYIKIYA